MNKVIFQNYPLAFFSPLYITSDNPHFNRYPSKFFFFPQKLFFFSPSSRETNPKFEFLSFSLPRAKISFHLKNFPGK